MKSPIIQVENLSFDYPNHRALDNVNFSLTAGSITALVGPNGAGKSTLLRCIAALETPLSGRVLLDGQDVLDDPRYSHTKMGYLSDDFGLYDNLTVKQCLTFAAESQGVAETNIHAVVGHVAEQLVITNKLDQLAGELSRGQRQRVAIGQAIIHSPRLLLLDEPASGLDPEARYSLSQVFLTLKEAGMTLFVSSHILAELEDYCTDMMVLKAGKVLDQKVVHTQIVDTLSRVSIEVAADTASAQLLTFLETLEEVSEISSNGMLFSLTLNETQMQRQALLTKIIQSGIQLNQFGLDKNNMQDNYLKIVNEEASDVE